MARRSFDWKSVTEQIKKQDKPKSFGGGDDDLFKPQVNKEGNAMILMRFLPPHLDEELPFVKKYSHGFQGPNGWFIEDCPTSIGEKCPVCTFNSSIWDSDEQRARNQKRKLSLYANVMILKDENNPENNGKIFKYRYGIKIHEKIMEKIAPESSIDDPIQVFDYESGANFKLKVKTVKSGARSYPNYDSSSFAEPSALSINGSVLSDAELDEVDAKLLRLQPLVEKKNFKSYKDLAIKLSSKIGEVIPIEPGGYQKPAPKVEASIPEAPEAPSESFSESTSQSNDNGFLNDDDENDDDFFKKLKGDED
tara:strand:+ start:18261 stop:19184 length:924 start_codon:yes stop_codon:yes gene_type:complete